MRITGGELKGRVIKGKLPDSVRPTTDMARETLFNILDNLVDLDGIKILDLFAGSGIVSFEAISRGIKHAEMIDISGQNIKQIKENITLFRIQDQAQPIRSNFKKALKSENKYDLIFADPPYDSGFYQTIIDLVIEFDKLNNGGILILEHRPEINFNYYEFELLKERASGSTKFTILRKSCDHSKD